VAALALFLDAWHGESGSERSFDNARLIIEPTASGKRVRDLDREEE
jgi:predicted SpoU family rRNA methylase